MNELQIVKKSRIVFAAAFCLVLVGCKPDAAVRQGAVVGDGAKSATAEHQSTPLDKATLGTLAGVVKLTGRPPAPVEIDMTMDPACGMSGGGDNYSEQYVSKSGGLGNVFIYVKSGPAAAMNYVPAPAPPVVMDQKGCRYVPHVVGVMRGGSVEFRNSDLTMHNVHTMPTTVGSQPIDISEGPKGTPQVKQFNQDELMIPVRCNNHPWMNAFINVVDTPFFAVTAPDGSFQIAGLPAGTYTLVAVHEKLGQQTIELTVKPQQTAAATLHYAVK